MKNDNLKNNHAQAGKCATGKVTPDGEQPKHNLKMISLDEETWVATYQCKRCGFQKTMKAAFVCR
jgi:hypothetical protein